MIARLLQHLAVGLFVAFLGTAPAFCQEPANGSEAMAEAIKALARRDPYPLVHLLVRKDIDSSVREASVQLLKDFGMRGTVALLRVGESVPALLPIAARIHGLPPSSSLRELLTVLWESPAFEEAVRAEDAHVRPPPADADAAAARAAESDWVGLAAAIPYATDLRYDVRSVIAANMARHAHPGGYRILASMLASVDPASGATALEALAVVLPPGAIEAARPFLADDDELRLTGAVAVVDALQAAIDLDTGLRALGIVRSPASREVIAAMQRAPGAERLPVLLMEALTRGEVRDEVTVARAVLELGLLGNPALAQSLLEHPHPALRAFALEAALRSPEGSLLDPAVRVSTCDAHARDASPFLRRAAAAGLGTAKDPLARASLVVLLGDACSFVREEAAASLRNQDPRDAAPALRRAAGSDPDPSVRHAARLSLYDLGVEDRLDLLAAAVEDPFLGPTTRRRLRERLPPGSALDETSLRNALRQRLRQKP